MLEGLELARGNRLRLCIGGTHDAAECGCVGRHRTVAGPQESLNKPFPVPQSRHSGSPASSGLAVTREGSQDSPDFPCSELTCRLFDHPVAAFVMLHR